MNNLKVGVVSVIWILYSPKTTMRATAHQKEKILTKLQ